MDEVFRVFESEGQDAALALYNKFRKQNKLNEEQRLALALAADQQGLNNIALKILSDAKEDFPASKMIQENWKKLNKGK